MAGTTTIRSFFTVLDLGKTTPPLSVEFTVAGTDANISRTSTLAATTTEALQLGTVSVTTTTPWLWLHLITGGTTKATGLSLCTASATWADSTYQNIILLQGQVVCIPVQLSTLSVKNLSSSACTYEYAFSGDAS